MSERDIFLALLDIADDTERAAYLERACGGEAELRGRVEGLLQSHQAAGSFLDLRSDSSPGLKNHSQPVHRKEEAGDAPTLTHAENRSEGGEALAFLEPSERPDSLGRLGHYEVLEVLGQGGFGIVYRAFDEVLQRVVAVKVLAPELAVTSPARKRFLREARSSAQVRHENVVQVHAVEEQPLPHLVMEVVPGETLQQRLDRTGSLEIPEVLWIGRQIAEGLAAAHATGLIHRDIKPSNILLDGLQRQVKITDFGLARAADDASLTRSEVIAGTPMYMAPEQAKGVPLDQRADLFSLGSVLYAVLTGRPPFRAETTLAMLKRVAEDTPRPIRDVIPEVPEWLCRIIEKLHAKEPGERFQSAREVADTLADCEAQPRAHKELLNPTNQSNLPRQRDPRLTLPGCRCSTARTGWEPGTSGKWAVKDGVLVGAGRGLLWSRNSYRDFHLRARVRSNAESNATVSFRSAPERHGEACIGRCASSACKPGTVGLWSKEGWERGVDYRQELVPAAEWFDLHSPSREHLQLQAEGLGDGPGLEGAAARGVRRVAVSDLGKMSQASNL